MLFFWLPEEVTMEAKNNPQTNTLKSRKWGSTTIKAIFFWNETDI